MLISNISQDIHEFKMDSTIKSEANLNYKDFFQSEHPFEYYFCRMSNNSVCERYWDVGYTGAECACVPCPNVNICKGWGPQHSFDHFEGICKTCTQVWGKKLDFIQTQHECPICFEQCTTGVRHPSNCHESHIFCLQCLGELFNVKSTQSSSTRKTIQSACPLCRTEFQSTFQKKKKRWLHFIMYVHGYHLAMSQEHDVESAQVQA